MAEENTLDELFRRDPLNLSIEEARQVVAWLRARRGTWAQAEAQRRSEGKKQPKRSAGVSKESAKGALAEISIDDLMGDQ